MPDLCNTLRDRMLALHPDWEYKLWNESNISKLVNQDIYDKLPKHRYCFKSDIIRYEIVYKYGGVYVDSDILFLKNIDNLLYGDFLVTKELPDLCIPCINNCIIGAQEKNNILQYIILKMEEVFDNKFEEIKKIKGEHVAGLESVGPRFLDSCIRSFCPEVVSQAFSTKYFSPFRPREMPEALYKHYPDAYALHLWNHTHKLKNIDIQRILDIHNVNT